MSELENYRRRSADLALARKLKLGVWIISIVVLVLVGLMRRPEFKIALPEGVTLWFLPPFHAVLNTGAALSLMGALVAIKAKRVALHQRCVYLALGLSALFLLSYVVYHFTLSETLFGDANRDGILQGKREGGGRRDAIGIPRGVVVPHRLGRAGLSLHPADLRLRFHQPIRQTSSDGALGLSGLALRRGDRAGVLSDVETLLLGRRFGLGWFGGFVRLHRASTDLLPVLSPRKAPPCAFSPIVIGDTTSSSPASTAEPSLPARSRRPSRRSSERCASVGIEP